MNLGLVEQMAIISELRTAGDEKVECAHSNENCHVFHTDVELVPVNRETGHYPPKTSTRVTNRN